MRSSLSWVKVRLFMVRVFLSCHQTPSARVLYRSDYAYHTCQQEQRQLQYNNTIKYWDFTTRRKTVTTTESSGEMLPITSFSSWHVMMASVSSVSPYTIVSFARTTSSLLQLFRAPRIQVSRDQVWVSWIKQTRIPHRPCFDSQQQFYRGGFYKLGLVGRGKCPN